MDFTAWCALIRNSIHWATGIDPCKTREGRIADDDATSELARILAGWASLCRCEDEKAITTGKAISLLKSDEFGIHEDLHSLFSSWTKNEDLPSSDSLGRKLAKIRGRVVEEKDGDGKIVGRKALDFKNSNQGKLWYVKRIPPPVENPRSETCETCETSSALRSGENQNNLLHGTIVVDPPTDVVGHPTDVVGANQIGSWREPVGEKSHKSHSNGGGGYSCDFCFTMSPGASCTNPSCRKQNL